MKRILVVKHLVPASKRAGTDIVSFYLLKLLSLDIHVSFLGLAHSKEELEEAVELKAFCKEVHTVFAPNKRPLFHRIFYKLWYALRVLRGQSL